jgi:response regulator RpfG family c-di-GMP phosphodiesterase
MPGLDGLEICRRVRALPTRQPPYLILLTVRDSRQDMVAGLQGGADDYIAKPFDREELRARLQTGRRILRLQRDLAEQLRQSEAALSQVKQLQGLLPICSYCKKIRDDQNYWRQVEEYISAYSEARFSHGICPTCWEGAVLPELEKSSGRPCSSSGDV